MSAAAQIPTRQLGRNGPQVSAMGLGLMGLSAFYGAPKPQAERLALLDAAYQAGERHWDSADVYGDSEDLLGEWFRLNPEKRKDIFLATKFANTRLPDGTLRVDSSPEYARQAVEKSLKRLGVDSIDLYYVHRLDKETPVEKTIAALAELQAAGKIKHIGVSEVSAAALRRAAAVAPIAAVQIEYSLMTLDIERPDIALLQACRDLGVAVVAYSPVGRGFITGAVRSRADFEEGDWRLMAPRFSEANFPKNLALVDKVAAMAQRKGVTTTQLALAWLLAQGNDIIPIPGTTKVERLHENLAALAVELTAAENKEIREAAEQAEVTGERYPAAMAGALFADSPALKA